MCVYMYVHTYIPVHMHITVCAYAEIRGHLLKEVSLFPLYGFQESKLDHEVWKQSLSTEPSSQLIKNSHCYRRVPSWQSGFQCLSQASEHFVLPLPKSFPHCTPVAYICVWIPGVHKHSEVIMLSGRSTTTLQSLEQYLAHSKYLVGI